MPAAAAQMETTPWFYHRNLGAESLHWGAVIDGCKVFRRDRQGRRGGRLAFCAKTGIDCTELSAKGSDAQGESLWVKIGDQDNKGTSVAGVYYRPSDQGGRLMKGSLFCCRKHRAHRPWSWQGSSARPTPAGIAAWWTASRETRPLPRNLAIQTQHTPFPKPLIPTASLPAVPHITPSFKLHVPYPPRGWPKHVPPLCYPPWRFIFLCTHPAHFFSIKQDFSTFLWGFLQLFSFQLSISARSFLQCNALTGQVAPMLRRIELLHTTQTFPEYDHLFSQQLNFFALPPFMHNLYMSQ